MANSINRPLVAFSATSNADQLLVTGDNSLYQVLLPNEIFDYGNNFSASTFLAPTTGKYVFGTVLYFSGLTAAMTDCLAYIQTTSHNYYLMKESFAATQYTSTFEYTLSSSLMVSLNAGDTAKLYIQFANGAKAVNLLGFTGLTPIRAPYFYGYLLSSI